MLETVDDLVPMVEHLHQQLDEAGRDPATVDISFTTGKPGPAEDGFDPAAELEALARMASIGVTWSSVPIPGDTLDHAIEALQRYGEEVIRAGPEERRGHR